MQKIDLTELQAAADSRQLIASTQPQKRTEQQERIVEEIWKTLAGVYGSSLVSQYGEVMPEEWIALLKGLTPSQIKEGLNKLATRESSFPPNGVEFRQLCLPETISPDGKNTSAYLEFSNEAHPEHKQYSKSKRIESASTVSKRKDAGNNHLKNLKDLF